MTGASLTVSHRQAHPYPDSKALCSVTRKHALGGVPTQAKQWGIRGSAFKAAFLKRLEGTYWHMFQEDQTFHQQPAFTPSQALWPLASPHLHLVDGLTSIWSCLTLLPQYILFSIGADGWAGIGMLLDQALHTLPVEQRDRHSSLQRSG